MSALLQRHWTRQPQIPIEVNPNWPFAKFIKVAWIPSFGVQNTVNLAARNAGSYTIARSTRNPTLSAGRHGLSAKNPSGGFTTAFTLAAGTGGTHRTIIVVLNSVSAVSGTGFFEGTGFVVGLTTAALPVINTNSGNRITGTALATNTPYVLGFSWTTSDYRLYQNGILDATTTAAFSAGGNALAMLGSTSAFGNGAQPDVAMLLLFEGVMLPAEVHASLAANPWQVFEPLKLRNYDFLSAGAAGGTEYEYTGSGGIDFGGAATLQKGKFYTGVGGIEYGGAALWAHGLHRTGSGGIVFAGDAAIETNVVPAASSVEWKLRVRRRH